MVTPASPSMKTSIQGWTIPATAQLDIAAELRHNEQQGHAVEKTREHGMRRELDDPRDAGEPEQNLHQSREQDAHRQRDEAHIRIGAAGSRQSCARRLAWITAVWSAASGRATACGPKKRRRARRRWRSIVPPRRPRRHRPAPAARRRAPRRPGAGRHRRRDQREAGQRLAPGERQAARRKNLLPCLGHAPLSPRGGILDGGESARHGACYVK